MVPASFPGDAQGDIDLDIVKWRVGVKVQAQTKILTNADTRPRDLDMYELDAGHPGAMLLNLTAHARMH